MICTPIECFAMVLERASEMNEPMKPKNAANTSSPKQLWPCAASQVSSPVRRATIDSTSTTARLVRRNRKMRFIFGSLQRARGHPLARLLRNRTLPVRRYPRQRGAAGVFFKAPVGLADDDPERAPDEEAHGARAA